MSQFYVNESPGAGPINTINSQPPVLGNFNLTSAGASVAITSSPGTINFEVSDLLNSYIRITAANSPYTVVSTDYFISVDSSGGPVTVKFPNAPSARETWVVKDALGTSNVNAITLTTVGGVVIIDGSTSVNLTQSFQANDVLFNGSAYELF